MSPAPAGAASAARGPLLDVRGLSVSLDGREPGAGRAAPIDGVSFTVDAGACVGLVGESGCGKSMTALALLGLLDRPARVVAGEAWFEGADLLAGASRRARGRRVGMVFQDPMTALNPVHRALDQVAEAVLAHQPEVDEDEAEQRALALLDEVGFPEPAARARAFPHQLSGGMRQRVMIAIALANSPSLLIADEPTTALDVTIQAQILALLADRRRARGLGVLLITHDLAVVAQQCARVVVMYAGQVVEAGPTRDVLAEPAHPYTRGLLGALPGRRPPGSRLEPVEGVVPPLDRAAADPACRFAGRCTHANEACRSTPRLRPLAPAVDARVVACHHVDPGGTP